MSAAGMYGGLLTMTSNGSALLKAGIRVRVRGYGYGSGSG